jgi:hypothetical protein
MALIVAQHCSQALEEAIPKFGKCAWERLGKEIQGETSMGVDRRGTTSCASAAAEARCENSQNAEDLAREAVSCNGGLGGSRLSGNASNIHAGIASATLPQTPLLKPLVTVHNPPA